PHSAALTVTGNTQWAGYGFASIPGQRYTISAYVWAPAGAVVSMYTGFITTWGDLSALTWGSLATWVDPVPGSGSASTSTTGAWQRLVVTVTADIGLTPVAFTANTACTFYV